MGYVITSNGYITPSTYLYSSQNASFPASNINDYTHPYRSWKGTDCVSGSTYVGVDLGSSKVATALVIDRCNVGSIKVQAQDADPAGGWATPDYDSGSITVSRDAIDGRYKLYYPFDPTPTRRYFRILSLTDAVDINDGTSVMSIGSAVLLGAVTTWLANPGFPYEMVPLQAVIDNADFACGGREPVSLGNRYCQLAMQQSVMPLAAKNTLFTVMGTYSRTTPFVFYRNNGDTSEVYIVRRVGDARVSQAGPNHYQISGLVLEEVV